MTIIKIARSGKKPQKYTILKRLQLNDYLAKKCNGVERPKIAYIISLTVEEEALLEQNPRSIKR